METPSVLFNHTFPSLKLRGNGSCGKEQDIAPIESSHEAKRILTERGKFVLSVALVCDLNLRGSVLQGCKRNCQFTLESESILHLAKRKFGVYMYKYPPPYQRRIANERKHDDRRPG